MTLPILQDGLNLLAAVALGAAIGFERQWRQRLAGLRTNTLVALGAATFILFSRLTPGEGDAARVGAQVVSGIGFLGAGVIFKEGLNVRGLNTAATLWCSAAVGLLAGDGFIAYGALGAALVIGANVVLRPLVKAINRQPVDDSEVDRSYEAYVVCNVAAEPKVRAILMEGLAAIEHIELSELEIANIEDTDRVELTATLTSHKRRELALHSISGRLTAEPGVSRAGWREADAIGLAGRPNDPLDLGLHQPLDDRRQVFVEPSLEHRAQHFPRHAFGQFRGPGGQIGRERLEGRGDGLVGLRRQERRLVLGRAVGRRLGRHSTSGSGWRQTTFGAPGSAAGSGRRRAAAGSAFEETTAGLSGAPFNSTALAGSRSSAMIVRMEAKILLHRRLVRPLRPTDRLVFAIVHIRVDRAHAQRFSHRVAASIECRASAPPPTAARPDLRSRDEVNRRPPLPASPSGLTGPPSTLISRQASGPRSTCS